MNIEKSLKTLLKGYQGNKVFGINIAYLIYNLSAKVNGAKMKISNMHKKIVWCF